MKVGFIGIGEMGLPLARRLSQAGFQVSVYDSNKSRFDLLKEERNIKPILLEDLVIESDVIFSMLPNDESLLSIVNAIVERMVAKQIHVSLSTVSPEATQKCFVLHELNNSQFVAAPVIGRSSSAEQGQLTVLLSGHKESKQKVTALLQCFGQHIFDLGSDVTKSAIAKLAANFMVATAIESMGEACVLVEKNGINASVFMEAVTSNMFSCPVYHYHARNIAQQKFMPAGFSTYLGMKDISLMLSLATQSKTVMPMLGVLWQHLNSSLAKGRGQLDWSSMTLACRESSLGAIKEIKQEESIKN